MSGQTSPASNSALHWDLEYPGSGSATGICAEFIVGAGTSQAASGKSHQEITDVPHRFRALSEMRTFRGWFTHTENRHKLCCPTASQGLKELRRKHKRPLRLNLPNTHTSRADSDTGLNLPELNFVQTWPIPRFLSQSVRSALLLRTAHQHPRLTDYQQAQLSAGSEASNSNLL